MVFTSLSRAKVNGTFRNYFSPKANKNKEVVELNILLSIIVLGNFLGWKTTYNDVIKSVRHGIIKENNLDG